MSDQDYNPPFHQAAAMLRKSESISTLLTAVKYNMKEIRYIESDPINQAQYNTIKSALSLIEDDIVGCQSDQEEEKVKKCVEDWKIEVKALTMEISILRRNEEFIRASYKETYLSVIYSAFDAVVHMQIELQKQKESN